MVKEKVVKTNYTDLPWATLMAVLFSVAAGIAQFIKPEVLSFDTYTSQVVLVWSLLAVGRGLALKEQETIVIAPFNRFLNTFPWATVVTGIVAVVGYIGVLTSDSLSFQEYGSKMVVLIGALGLGRGLGTLKKDVTFGSVGSLAGLANHPDGPNGPGVAITDENVEEHIAALDAPEQYAAQADENLGGPEEAFPPTTSPPGITDPKQV